MHRWIIPFSKQFAFIALSHAPLPRAWRCWLLDAWLRHLYWFCMIERMAPAPGSARSFSGQCSDAFFKLTHRVRGMVPQASMAVGCRPGMLNRNLLRMVVGRAGKCAPHEVLCAAAARRTR